MKVFLNKIGEIKYIDCDSDEFVKIYPYLKSSPNYCPYITTSSNLFEDDNMYTLKRTSNE